MELEIVIREDDTA